MDRDKQAIIDEASEHPYECRCAKCEVWWASMPPEDDDENEIDYEHDCGEDTCCCAGQS